jgi:hypothetical protein
MTTGFQHQSPLVNFCIPKSAVSQHPVGKKVQAKPEERLAPPEPRTFK